MAPLVSTIEIACPAHEVFTFATDPRHFADWQPDVVTVRMVTESRFVTTRRIRGAERELVQQVTRNEPPHRWAAASIDGPVRPHATITVEPLSGGARSRITFTLDFEGHGLGVPLIPLIRRQAQKVAPTSYQNLKRLLESDHSRR